MTGTLGQTTDGAAVELDLDRLIGSHLAVVANSGGGKSGLIRRLLETTHGRIQHIVLDVEDEFYTLRERFDYVIAGGADGDAPAALESAEGLALATLQHGFSLIVQLNDLGASGAPAFVGRFLTAMIQAPRELWRPVLVVLDEAQRFAPQDGSTAATAGVKALTAQGRKRGFTAVLASQRIAKIDADVRGDVNNWLLGRVGQALDRRTVADALGFAPSGAEARGLQSLPDRSFWGFGPAVAREPVLFRVADVETTPVRPGQARTPTPPPPEALRAILQGLAVPAASAAEGEAAPRPSTSELAAARAEGRSAGLAEGERRGEARGLALGIAQAQAALAALAGAPVEHNVDTQPPAPSDRPKLVAQRPRTPHPAGAARPAPTSGATGLVQVAARAYPAGLTWAQIAALAGRKPTGGHFNTSRKTALTEGWLTEEGGVVTATAKGRKAVGVEERTGSLLDAFVEALPGPADRFLCTVAQRPGITLAEVADMFGMQPRGGHWNTGWSTLRRNGLIREDGGRVYLSDLLAAEAA